MATTTLRALRPVLPYRGAMPLVGAALSDDEEQMALHHAKHFGWKLAEVLTPAYAPYNALVLVGDALEPYVATIESPPVEVQKFNQNHDDHGRFSADAVEGAVGGFGDTRTAPTITANLDANALARYHQQKVKEAQTPDDLAKIISDVRRLPYAGRPEVAPHLDKAEGAILRGQGVPPGVTPSLDLGKVHLATAIEKRRAIYGPQDGGARPHAVPVQKYNQNHDARGEFASGSGGPGPGAGHPEDAGPTWFLRGLNQSAAQHAQLASAAPTGSTTEAYHQGAVAAHAAVSAAIQGGGPGPGAGWFAGATPAGAPSSAPTGAPPAFSSSRLPANPMNAGPGWFAGADRLAKNSEAYHQGAAAAHSVIGRVLDHIKNGGLSNQWIGEHGWG